MQDTKIIHPVFYSEALDDVVFINCWIKLTNLIQWLKDRASFKDLSMLEEGQWHKTKALSTTSSQA